MKNNYRRESSGALVKKACTNVCGAECAAGENIGILGAAIPRIAID